MICACREASTLPATSLKTVRKAIPWPAPAARLAATRSQGLLHAPAAAIMITDTPSTASPAGTANRLRTDTSWLRAEAPRVRPARTPMSGRESTPSNPAKYPGARDRQKPKTARSEEHTSELQSLAYLVCRLLLEKK